MNPYKKYPESCAAIVEVCRRLYQRNRLSESRQ